MNIISSLNAITRGKLQLPQTAVSQIFATIAEESALPSDVFAAIALTSLSTPWVLSPTGDASVVLGSIVKKRNTFVDAVAALEEMDFSAMTLTPFRAFETLIEEYFLDEDDLPSASKNTLEVLISYLKSMRELEDKYKEWTAGALLENSKEFSLLANNFISTLVRTAGLVPHYLPGHSTVKSGALTNNEKHFSSKLNWEHVHKALADRIAGSVMIISGTHGGKTTLSHKLVKGTVGVTIVWGEPLNNSEYSDSDSIHRVDTLYQAVLLAQIYARLNVPVIIDSLRLSWVAFKGGAVIRGLNADLVWAMTTLNQIMADSMADVVVMVNPPYVVDDKTFSALEGVVDTRSAVIANKQLLHTVTTMIRGSVTGTVLIENYKPSIIDVRRSIDDGDDRFLFVASKVDNFDNTSSYEETAYGPEIAGQSEVEKKIEIGATTEFSPEKDDDDHSTNLSDEAWDAAFSDFGTDDELVDDKYASRSFD